MTKIKRRLIILLMIISFNATAQSIIELPLVLVDSKIQWTGTKVIGFHQGTVKLKKGVVVLKNHQLAGGSFEIDMTSIANTDIPDSDLVPKRKIEEHLKSSDFFDVVRFPTARLEIVRVSVSKENTYSVTANLTLKGITKSINFIAEASTQRDDLFIAQANFTIDRQQWGVAYKGLKDELVHDDIKFNVIIKARK
jgi:polyisoprenoid-binding protein YceI